MLDSIQKGELPLRNPRDYSDRLPYAVPKIIRSFEEQVDADGLNAWLDAHKEWGITFRFKQPAPLSTAPQPLRTVPVTRQRELEILRVIAELNFEVLALPARKPGKPGVKAAVRLRLNYNNPDLFDADWERLLKRGSDGGIKYADTDATPSIRGPSGSCSGGYPERYLSDLSTRRKPYGGCQMEANHVQLFPPLEQETRTNVETAAAAHYLLRGRKHCASGRARRTGRCARSACMAASRGRSRKSAALWRGARNESPGAPPSINRGR